MKAIKFNERSKIGFILKRSSVNLDELIRFFSSFSAITQSLERFDKTGYFYVPSIYSGDSDAVCLGSFFSDKPEFGVTNYLEFYDSGRRFYIIQHHMFFSGIVLPDLDLAIVKTNTLLHKPKKIASDVFERSWNRDLSSEVREIRFGGFVNGYDRPYHFFYDRLPYVLKFMERFPKVMFYDLKGYDFLSVGDSKIDLKEADRLSSDRKCIFVLPSRAGEKMDAERSSNLVISHVDDEFEQYDDTVFVFWVGVCQEKRRWPERDRAIVAIINYILEIKSNVLVVFDGMTATESDLVEAFRDKYCKYELESMRFILSSICGSVSHVNLIGEHARKKLLMSQRVDCFFANALTDSMWPAHFGRARGLSYHARCAKIAQHDHPRTTFVPEELIQDLDDGETNWARKGYSIDPQDALNCFKKFFEGNFR